MAATTKTEPKQKYTCLADIVIGGTTHRRGDEIGLVANNNITQALLHGGKIRLWEKPKAETDK